MGEKSKKSFDHRQGFGAVAFYACFIMIADNRLGQPIMDGSMAALDFTEGDTALGVRPDASITLEDLGRLLELEGDAVGVAVFDESLRLTFVNEQYGPICGYDQEELVASGGLRGLIRFSLQRAGREEQEIAPAIERAVQLLKRNGSHRFSFELHPGCTIRVVRQLLSDGAVVEMVRPHQAGGERDQMAELAQAARLRLGHALEAMADGFALFDANDRLVAYNQRYIELNPEIADLVAPGKRFEDLVRAGVERGGYALNDMEPEQFIAWRIEQHRNPGPSYDLLLNDGRWVRVYEKRTDDGGVVGRRSDVTEHKRRELKLTEVSDQLRVRHMMFDTALHNMAQGLCMFDAEQTLIVANRRYLEMYGFSPDVVKPGIKLPEIMEYSISIGNYSAEDAERALAARPMHALKRERSTLKQYLRDGRVIAVVHQPMTDGGSIATYQDVTELERHEEKMVAYTKRLEQSNRELQDFAYVASHDLQEPLRKIETFGDRLVAKFAEQLPDQAKTYINRMQDATSRMRLLINDLLGYSRITTNAKPFRPTDLRDQCEIVVADLEVRVRETQATVEIGDLPTIHADEVQIRQLFQNLISNALKFQRPNVAPVVKISSEITRGNTLEGEVNRVMIYVSDNGIGFNNKYKQQIFTIFQRLHGRNEYEGTGIGLATVRKIVERHGGDIDADGVEGEGATFIVTLPETHASNANASTEVSNAD